MLDLSLRVQRDGTTYTYNNDRIRLRDTGISQSVSDREVELADVQLQITPDDGGASEFAGFTDPVQFPSGLRLRAELQAGGDVVLNGLVVSGDVSYDADVRCWIVDLFDEAQADLWRILDAYFYQQLFYEYTIAGGTQGDVNTSDALNVTSSEEWTDDLQAFAWAVSSSFGNDGSGPVNNDATLDISAVTSDDIATVIVQWSIEISGTAGGDITAEVQNSSGAPIGSATVTSSNTSDAGEIVIDSFTPADAATVRIVTNASAGPTAAGSSCTTKAEAVYLSTQTNITPPDTPPSGVLDNFSVPCWVFEEFSVGSEWRLEVRTIGEETIWETPQSMLQFVFRALNAEGFDIDFEIPETPPGLVMHAEWIRLPRLLEQIASYFGWRLVVQYKAWPSDGLRLSVALTDWNPPGTPPEVGSVSAEEVLIETKERGNIEFALSGGANPERKYWEDFSELPDYDDGPITILQGDGSLPLFTEPLRRANTSVKAWTAYDLFERRTSTFSDPFQYDIGEFFGIDNSEELDIKLPPLHLRGSPAVPDLETPEDTTLYGVPLMPPTTPLDEDIEEDDHMFVGRLYDDGGTYRLLHWNHSGGQPRNPAWINNRREEQDEVYADLRTVTGAFLTNAAFSLSEYVAYDGIPFRTHEETRFVRGAPKDDVDFVLARPVGSPSGAMPSLPADMSTWTILSESIDVRLFQWVVASGATDYIYIRWNPTALNNAVEIGYKVRWNLNGAAVNEYFAGTTAKKRVSTFGGGGAGRSAYSGNYTVKIAPIDADGNLGAFRDYDLIGNTEASDGNEI